MHFPSKTVSVSIDAGPDKVYAFASHPENLPKWAGAFCKSVKKSGRGWVIETPFGPMKLKFAERNAFGILDHYVSPAPKVKIYVPMRVVANGSGSEVIFTIFRTPGMTDEQFADDSKMVMRDLKALKGLLEA